MKEESKTEILFEDLILRLKSIESKITAQSNSGEGVEDTLSNLQKLILISHDTFNEQLLLIVKKIGELKKISPSESRFVIHHPVRNSEIKHYFLFFPDLRNWIKTISQVKWVVSLLLMCILLIAINYALFKRNTSLNSDAVKYKYMKLAFPTATKSLGNYLDSAWLIKSKRQYMILKADSIDNIKEAD